MRRRFPLTDDDKTPTEFEIARDKKAEEQRVSVAALIRAHDAGFNKGVVDAKADCAARVEEATKEAVKESHSKGAAIGASIAVGAMVGAYVLYRLVRQIVLKH